MDELGIRGENLQLAMNHIKQLSEEGSKRIAIKKVRTEGDFFGLGNHKVTGEEFNERLMEIQQHISSQNESYDISMCAIAECYEALVAVKEDYLNRIMCNLAAIKKTNNDLREQDIKLGQESAKIKETMENISLITVAIRSFNNQLQSYSHLSDIDTIWEDCRNIQNNLRVVSDSITRLSQKTTDEINAANHKNQALSDRIKGDILTIRSELRSIKEYYSKLCEKVESTTGLLEAQMPDIRKTATFAEQIKNITHFGDVDIMWDQLQAAVAAGAEQKVSMDGLHQDINALQDYAAQLKKTIAELESFKACVSSMEHWMEVDDLWKQAEADQKRLGKIEQEHTERLTALAQADKQLLEGMASNAQDIASLKEYRDQLGGISHLEDVDRMWQNVAEHTERLAALTQVDKQLLEGMASNAQDIAGLKEYRDQLGGISHLEDVDRMWQNVAEHTERLAALTQVDDQLREGLSTNMQDITDLKKYRDQLSGISHLEDVDHMWQDIAEHTNQLVSGEQRDKALAAAIEQHKQDTDQKIAKTTETANVAVESLQKKVQYAYWIAGGSAGLAMIELILLLTKVI